MPSVDPVDRRIRASADLVDALASRLTERDRYLCRMLHEHRVLTVAQMAELAFDSVTAAQHRLVILYRHRLVERFRPFRPTGSAPYHYVLDRGGATVLADEQGIDIERLDYRRSKALGLATNQRLGHLVAANGFFTAAVAQTRHTGRYGELAAWWSEARCRGAWGRYARPDGYGEWRYGTTTSAFFLECDMGTEPHQRLAAKLEDYGKLAAATRGWSADTADTTLLFWFHSSSRERAFHLRVRNTAIPVATATAAPGRNPAGGIWWRLGDPDTHRLDLHRALYRTPVQRGDDDNAAYGSWDLARDIRRAAETAVDPAWPPRPPDPVADKYLAWD
jgi:hypothetical protein